MLFVLFHSIICDNELIFKDINELTKDMVESRIKKDDKNDTNVIIKNIKISNNVT